VYSGLWLFKYFSIISSVKKGEIGSGIEEREKEKKK
jgi:hypothetical protein